MLCVQEFNPFWIKIDAKSVIHTMQCVHQMPALAAAVVAASAYEIDIVKRNHTLTQPQPNGIYILKA